jgi:uncharacterized membrane protein
MQLPFHPFIVHFPVALTFILPILVVVFAFMIKFNKMTPKGWSVIIGLQLAVVVTGYISLETGETEEDRVEKVVSKKIIHEHEEAAEIFVGVSVILFVLSVAAFFIRKEISFLLKIGIAVLGILSCYLAYRTGHLGGELVYRYGAGSAYAEVEDQQGILPTPNENTSESPAPTSENESLKADENDYGNSDASEESDEEFKQED